jgi:hypothetical protein
MPVRFSFRRLLVGLGSLAIAGCTGTGATLGPVAPAHYDSRMSPSASSGALLYVSNGSSRVYIYSYPALKAGGKLSGFEQPEGLCVDKAGDIWVVDYGGDKLVEYAHGSHKSKATLKTPANHNPFACSIDPHTGDLAVTASYGGNGPGELYVYAKAKGTPKAYTDASFAYAMYPGYDDKGNIWLDGTNIGNKFVYAELPKGKTKFTSVKLKKGIVSPGNLQYAGKYMALGDLTAGKIYQTSGSKVKGTTSFSDTSSIFGYYIDGSSVVCADGSEYVEIYAYPAGGAPTATVYFGSAASLAVSNK